MMIIKKKSKIVAIKMNNKNQAIIKGRIKDLTRKMTINKKAKIVVIKMNQALNKNKIIQKIKKKKKKKIRIQMNKQKVK